MVAFFSPSFFLLLHIKKKNHLSHIQVCMHTFIHAYIHTHVHMDKCIHAGSCKHAHTHARTCMRTHAHAHIHAKSNPILNAKQRFVLVQCLWSHRLCTWCILFTPLSYMQRQQMFTTHEAAGGGGWRCYLCDCSDGAVYCKAYRILCSHVQDMSRLKGGGGWRGGVKRGC